MKIHLLHDWGLWSPAHMANGELELRQYRHCQVCAKLDHRMIGKMSSGRFDAEIADCNRTEALSLLPPTKSPLHDLVWQIARSQELQREHLCRVEELAQAIKAAAGL